MKRVYIILLIVCGGLNVISDTIWSEGFTGYPNHTGLINIDGVATPSGAYPLADGKWTLDVSGAPNFDYFYTIDAYDDFLRVENTGIGGEVVFRSEIIDISDYYMIICQVSYLLSEYVSTVTEEDYIRTSYVLDGGEEQIFLSGNGEINGQVTHSNYYAVQNNLCGNTIQIVIRMSCDEAGDLYDIKHVRIHGVPTEPTDYPTNFTAEENEFDEIVLMWDSTTMEGTFPDGYLIKISTGEITDPVDGIDPVWDDDLTDGIGEVYRNANSPGGIYYFYLYNYSGSTTYHFKLYPYTNSESTCHPIDYKTGGDVPTASVTTEMEPIEPGSLDIIINEIRGDDVTPDMPLDGYIELLNLTPFELDLGNIEVRYYDNGSPVPTATMTLLGHVNPHEFIIICQDYSMFSMTHLGATAHFEAPRDPEDWMTSLFPLDGDTDSVTLHLIDSKSQEIDKFNNYLSPWSWNGGESFERITVNDGGDESNWEIGDGIPGEDNTELLTIPEIIEISAINGDVFLNWQPVIGATSYSIYVSENPEAIFPSEWTVKESNIYLTNWTDIEPVENIIFYRIIAVKSTKN